MSPLLSRNAVSALLLIVPVFSMGECEDGPLPGEIDCAAQIKKQTIDICSAKIGKLFKRANMGKTPADLKGLLVFEHCRRSCGACQSPSPSLAPAEADKAVALLNKLGRRHMHDDSEDDEFSFWFGEVLFPSLQPLCQAGQGLLDDQMLGYVAPLVSALRSCTPSMQEDMAAAKSDIFGYTSGDDFYSTRWDHVYFWAMEDILEGWNRTACESFPQVCRCLQSAAVRPYVDGKLQWADKSSGYAALYRTAPGAEVGLHNGDAKLNVQVVLQAPPGVSLSVGDTTATYKAGDVLVWQDSCKHKVVHPESSLGDRVILTIKVPHPRLVWWAEHGPNPKKAPKNKANAKTDL